MVAALRSPEPIRHANSNGMQRFHVIDEGAVILRSKGVYRQAKVFRRGQDVFAGWGMGFIKLGPRSGTTNPNVSWEGVEAEGVVCDRVGGQPRWNGDA